VTTTRLDGHTPTLIACFAHFDVCFMLWVLLGALGAFIFDGTGVDLGMKGLIVGTPILMGSLLRVPLGLLSDRSGGRRIGLALLLFLFLPLTIGWLAPGTLPFLVVIALTLGSAGASFAIVLPLASRWYPAERQGLVMGIAAAGNSGTVIANLLAPRLANAVGWHNVFGIALIPLAAVLIVFWTLAKDAPVKGSVRTLREYVGAVAHADTWWFCFFYSVTFGGYVGLSSFLPVLLRDQFAVSPVTAGSLTAAAAFAGSLSRPFGGYVADRLGGVRLLERLLFMIALAYAAMAMTPGLTTLAPIVLLAMVCLGFGNGVVFQLVPQRFQREIGSITGLVGAIGGVGGFFLPTLLGVVRQATGSYTAGLVTLGLVAAAAGVSLRTLQDPTRRRSWHIPLATASDLPSA
jgi:NNP family nitrate/nitrite transporter-like MFS transporter